MCLYSRFKVCLFFGLSFYRFLYSLSFFKILEVIDCEPGFTTMDEVQKKKSNPGLPDLKIYKQGKNKTEKLTNRKSDKQIDGKMEGN